MEAARYALEEQKKMVEAVSLGVAGLFSKDLLPKFFDSVEKIIDKIDDAKGQAQSKEQRRRTKVDRTMRELTKLNTILGAPVAMKE